MKKILILILAIVIWRVKLLLAGELIPKIGFIKKFTESRDWISGSDVVQISMLIIALLLIYFIGKGKFADFGFQPAKIKIILKAFFIAVVISFVLFILNAISIMITGMPEGAGEGSGSGNLLKNIISIWLLASIIEEIFYRGFLQTFMNPLKDYGIKLKKIYLSLPVLAAAIMFGLMHFCLIGIVPDRIVYFIVVNAFILGTIAGYFREKSGSLIPAIGVHIGFNVVGMMIPQI
ncbi:MAG: CPBP family intramembrane metalloprotease, partial [Candidatus Cloacimonetes bacterium]|nr:CPBP family intramembrane metalloprotease [Candidatus Cloacimonadota bacterium]